MKLFQRSILAAVTASGVAMALAVPATPAAATITGVPKLTYSAISSSTLSALKSQIGTTTLTHILGDLNRNMVVGSACSQHALDGSSTLATKLCFDSADEAVTYWRPQGVAGAAERASDAGAQWGTTGKHPMLVTWYDHDDGTGTGEDKVDKGVRISVVDPTAGSEKYRHALLAEPFVNDSGNASFKALTGVHASGLAWDDTTLYVTDANKGIRVFSMASILDLSGSTADSGLPINRTDTGQVGRHSSVWYSFGYSYVFLQVGTFKLTGASDAAANAYACDTTGTAPEIDFADTDRTVSSTHPRLVTGEFCHTGRLPKVTVWNLEEMNNIVSAGSGTSTALSTVTSTARDIQGGSMVNGAFHALTGYKCGRNYLESFVAPDGSQTFAKQVPYGSEDAMYDRGTNRIYSVTEFPTGYTADGTNCGGRVLFGVQAP